MTSHIEYSSIGWEQFEDLCAALWFDEGYDQIRPYGRRRELGRDAVHVDPASEELTIFQFKRWTGSYSGSDMKSMIRDAAEKVKDFEPALFILNSSLPSNALVNDWIPELSKEVGFEVEYWDRSWLDLRLDNRRQDLRRRYFGVGVDYHTWASLQEVVAQQLANSLKRLSSKYNPSLYVDREAKATIEAFVESDSLCLALVDSAGRGKTNLMSAIAESMAENGKLVLLVDGSTHFEDDHALERLVATEWRYAAGDYPLAFQHFSNLLGENMATAVVVVDGLSETDNVPRAARAMRNLIDAFSEVSQVKLIVVLRDLSWPIFEYWLPRDQLFPVRPLTGEEQIDRFAFRLTVGDFTSDELEAAISNYSEEFDVKFEPVHDALQQLRHPLLLRLFCEVNRGQNLGSMGSVPIFQTFERYLDAKLDAVILRGETSSPRSDIQQLLYQLAAYGWNEHGGSSVDEDALPSLMPHQIPLEAGMHLIRLLEEEGLIEYRSQPLSPRRSLHFVFDEFQDFLLLMNFVSELPEAVRSETDRARRLAAIIGNLVEMPVDRDSMEFASLVGMMLPDIPHRSSLLLRILQWNFHAFSRCLGYIPPYGELVECSSESIQLLASELRAWYFECVDRHFEEISQRIDPAIHSSIAASGASSIGVSLTASPQCREISYEYRQRSEADEIDEANFTESYPVWQASLSSGDTTVTFPDPEHGLTVSVFRQEGPEGRTVRTLDFPVIPPFPGASLNVPERLAVHDLAGEVSYMIEKDRFPREPLDLVSERARAIASTLPLLEPVVGLDIARFRAEREGILGSHEHGSYDYVITRDRLSDLEWLLSLLGGPIRANLLPEPDQGELGDETDFWTSFSEKGLCSYLLQLFSEAVQMYNAIADLNFSSVKSHMNLFAQFPFTIRILTDREVIRYFVVPEESEDESQILCNYFSADSMNLADPTLDLRIDDLSFDDYSRSMLSARGGLISPIYPIQRTMPIRDCFSATPINSLMKEWLKSDIRDLFVL